MIDENGERLIDWMCWVGSDGWTDLWWSSNPDDDNEVEVEMVLSLEWNVIASFDFDDGIYF